MACLILEERTGILTRDRRKRKPASLMHQRPNRPDRDQVRLGYERKLFTDTVKLGAYEIETRLYEMLDPGFSNHPTEGRGVIKALLSARGDIRVTGDLIEVRLEQLSAPRYTQAMQSICQQLNAQSPRLPETDERLHFSVKTRPIGE